MDYGDFTLEASGITPLENPKRLRYAIRVLEEMAPEEAVTITCELPDLLRTIKRLEARQVSREALIQVGRDLALMILPIDSVPGTASIRELLARRLLTAAGKGVRLRLRLPRTLAGLPWEFTYVERRGGDGMDGFLALDPRLAFVRDEVFGMLPVAPAPGDLRVVVALASAPNQEQLDLATELKIITTAMNGVPGATLTAVENATLADVQAAVPGAHVFHFAGHGVFSRQMGELPGTYMGTGALAFQDQQVDAEQLGVNLHGRQVRLAVLAGCETARREGLSVWSGIAPALTKVDIPAVVANQYSIADTSAIVFSGRFYHALAGGLPIEDAVAAGRLAVYNLEPEGRDWGVPVLYLRAAHGHLFEGATNPALREQARAAAQADIVVRTGKVGPHGVVHGAKLHEELDGKLSISVTTGDVSGRVIGFTRTSAGGGATSVTVTTGDVDGEVIGGIFGSLKRRTRSGGGGRSLSERAGGTIRSGSRGRGQRSAPPPAVPPPPPQTPTSHEAEAVSVHTGNLEGGGTVIGTIHGNVTIVSGRQSENPSIEEKIRLDVATPTSVVVNEAFSVVIAVKQPGSPPLAEPDLNHVQSAKGAIFRTSEEEVVRYKVKVTGAGFTIEPESYEFRLRLGQDSPAIAFQATATVAGKRSLFVTAYQLGGPEPELAAQARLTIEVGVIAEPRPTASRPGISLRILREAILNSFSNEELQLLRADLEEQLRTQGINVRLSTETLGGLTYPAQVQNLIDALERINQTAALVEAVRQQRPSVFDRT
jgi:CHAT domain